MRLPPNFFPKRILPQAHSTLAYLFGIVLLLAITAALYHGGVHLARLKPETITIHDLPFALFLSFIRMSLAYLICLVLAFAFGLPAGRSALGERIIIPFIDVMQSVPVVAFFPAAISLFIGVSGGSRLGIEFAAVFLIFTGEAWPLAFGVYESIKTIPQDNIDAIASFGVRGSQKFWKLYAPACAPRLVYNSILAWSNGWFFLVACEIIAVGQVRYDLPGIGSFLSRAAEQDRIPLVIWGLVALSVLILVLDFLVWRPASIWAERFTHDYAPSATPSTGHFRSGLYPRYLEVLSPLAPAAEKALLIVFSPLLWLARTVLLPIVWDLPASFGVTVVKLAYSRVAVPAFVKWRTWTRNAQALNRALLWSAGIGCTAFAVFYLARWLTPPWPGMAREIPRAMLASTARVIAALALSLAWTLPVVLWTWNRPRLRQALNTVAQVGASLPAIALFPLIVLIAVRRFGGGMEAASIVLLVISMQWYILFNLLGGVASIPSDLAEAIRALGLKKVQTWKRLVLPAMRPALVTGAITAWGGGWNALVVSEYVTYKDHIMTVRGLGSLLNRSVYELGDHRAITLCITAMVGWIIIVNAAFWQPLYRSSAERYKFEA